MIPSVGVPFVVVLRDPVVRKVLHTLATIGVDVDLSASSLFRGNSDVRLIVHLNLGDKPHFEASVTYSAALSELQDDAATLSRAMGMCVVVDLHPKIAAATPSPAPHEPLEPADLGLPTRPSAQVAESKEGAVGFIVLLMETLVRSNTEEVLRLPWRSEKDIRDMAAAFARGSVKDNPFATCNFDVILPKDFHALPPLARAEVVEDAYREWPGPRRETLLELYDAVHLCVQRGAHRHPSTLALYDRVFVR